ncbi:MAG: hypothetical protein AB2421_18620 [Thermotaleaceae bacterium]
MPIFTVKKVNSSDTYYSILKCLEDQQWTLIDIIPSFDGNLPGYYLVFEKYESLFI